MRPRITSVGLIVLPKLAEHFEYPAHIDRTSLDALPAKPGVYFFLNRAGVPVYIGKSINIRSRVMSHLRTPEESAMLKATSRLDFQRTAGEIGALLLESRLIKKFQPAYNTQLKFMAESYALWLADGATCPQVVGCSEASWREPSAMYGLFASRSAAQEGLYALVRQHMLCPALLGLESTTHGRACFSRQIGRCLGACVGNESKEQHFLRLQSALEQLNTAIWPYCGPIGIIEVDHQWRQIHVIDRWSYLGSLEGRRKKIRLPARRQIDIDIYKILARPLADGKLTIGFCQVKQNAAYYSAQRP